ncbi:MAG: acetyl-CoA C-acyltransferase [Proteobacteria bacterium]|nr:acetyl-CoA C-acyltransferase [Pseudomonadota bacterium]
MVKQIQDVYIVAARRTALGKAKGVFRNKRPDDLLAAVLQNLMQKVPQLGLDKIEDVIIGCAMPEAEQGMNVARIAALLAGFPQTVPGVTINRFCASGLQAISMAADRIALGLSEVVIAGGVESMSMVPLGGHSFSANNRYFENKANLGIAFGMGITAENVAKQWQISRQEQDAFALASHQKALAAIHSEAFSEQIVPIQVETSLPCLTTCQVKTQIQEVLQDQGPRADTSLEALSKLKSVFSLKGSVTAGNSSQMTDGASALLLTNERVISEYQLQPLAKFRGFSVAGVAPEIMGIGPIKAIPLVLNQAEISLKDIGWIELNEAFAAQSLAVIKELGLPENKINPQGGAIALGHPLGATGAILATKLIYGARQRQVKYGMVTMCIGTGMGAAGIFELL